MIRDKNLRDQIESLVEMAMSPNVDDHILLYGIVKRSRDIPLKALLCIASYDVEKHYIYNALIESRNCKESNILESIINGEEHELLQRLILKTSPYGSTYSNGVQGIKDSKDAKIFLGMIEASLLLQKEITDELKQQIKFELLNKIKDL